MILLKKNNLEQLFVNDSDVLIFTNFDKDEPHKTTMLQYDFTQPTFTPEQLMTIYNIKIDNRSFIQKFKELFFKREKCDNIRTITILSFIKINYNKNSK